MRKFEEVYRVTAQSISNWVGENGRPSWKEPKEFHPLTAPKKNKKRKAVAEKGEKQTKASEKF
jgi:hypothetical protein